jgi:general secretion pathway protein F
MRHHPPTLDDLIGLNREIAALVKAGIPLELGLRGLSGSVGTRLGRLSKRLSERLADGRSLVEALAAEGPSVSAVYTAVVEAGLASGRLPQALESIAVSGTVLQETRRQLALALMYPAICLIVGYVMFCGFLEIIAPGMISSVEFFNFREGWPLKLLRFLYIHRMYVTLVVPSAVLAIMAITILLRETVTRGLWRRLTSFRWFIGRSLNLAQFTEILALQLEQSRPLASSFLLAAESTDDLRWRREAMAVGAELVRGSTLTQALRSATSLPPLVRWTLAVSERQGTLTATLYDLAEMYRRRALRRASILKTWLPVIITIFVTGTMAFAYGLVFVIPLRAFWIGLMQE